MLNNTQTNILKQFKETLSDNRSDLIEAVYVNLESKFKTVLTREEDSNVHIFISTMVDNILAGKLEFIEFIDNINKFFDSNKFDGYNSGTYSGLRQAMLDLSYVKDAKFSVMEAGVIAIILNLNDETIIEDRKTEIATQIHKYLSIGIITDTPIETSKISAEINASTGQSLIYNFCECIKRKFNFDVKYFVDYQQNSREFDVEEGIKEDILRIYNEKYNFIGKNFNVQDFYSISKTMKGIKRLDITLNELNEKDEIINTFKDCDIAMKDWELLEINEIKLTQEN